MAAGHAWGACTAINKRPANEDRYVVADLHDGWTLAAVFDGHGGAAVADWLAACIQGAVSAALHEAPGDPGAALSDAFLTLASGVMAESRPPGHAGAPPSRPS